MSKMAWELAGARCFSELAADTNVRAPVVVPRYARLMQPGVEAIDTGGKPITIWGDGTQTRSST